MVQGGASDILELLSHTTDLLISDVLHADAMEIKHFMGSSWFRHENPPQLKKKTGHQGELSSLISELFMAKVRFLSPQDFIIWAGLLLKSLYQHYAMCVLGESLMRMYCALSFNDVKSCLKYRASFSQ